jgi:hypothetical protein
VVRRGRVDSQRTDPLVHATVDTAAPGFGLCHTGSLGGGFVVLVDGGKGGIGLAEIWRGLLSTSGGRSGGLIVGVRGSVDSRVSAIRGGLRCGDEAKGGIIVAGAIGCRGVGGGSYMVSTAALPFHTR